MTLVRLVHLVTAVILAGALGACSLMSKNPAGPESAAVAEQGLWGSWISRDDDGNTSILHVFPAKGSEGRRLQLIFVGGEGEDGGWYALGGHASALDGDRHYLNLMIVATTPDMMAQLDEAYPDRAEFPYAYMPYRLVDADHFELGAPPMEAVLAAVKEGRLAGTVSEGAFPVARVSDTSENISAFLATLDHAKLFESPLKFTRIQPPT